MSTGKFPEYLRLVDSSEIEGEFPAPLVEGTPLTAMQLLNRTKCMLRDKMTMSRWLKVASALFQEGYGPIEGMAFPVKVCQESRMHELEEQLLTMNDFRKVRLNELAGKNIHGFWVLQTHSYPVTCIEVVSVHIHFDSGVFYLVDKSNGVRHNLDDLPDGSCLYVRVGNDDFPGGGGREKLPVAA